MRKLFSIILLVLILVGLTMSQTVQATLTSNVVLISHLFNSGGGVSSNAKQQIILNGALGQATTGIAQSEIYYLTPGFLASLPKPPTAIEEGQEPLPPSRIFLPLINHQ